MSQAEQTIKVQGESIFSVRPDQLSITLGVKTENQTVQKAQTERKIQERNSEATEAL